MTSSSSTFRRNTRTYRPSIASRIQKASIRAFWRGRVRTRRHNRKKHVNVCAHAYAYAHLIYSYASRSRYRDVCRRLSRSVHHPGRMAGPWPANDPGKMRVELPRTLVEAGVPLALEEVSYCHDIRRKERRKTEWEGERGRGW